MTICERFLCVLTRNWIKNWYTRLTQVQHLAGLLPVTGRSRGTGHPGLVFNRGGELLSLIP